MDEKLIQSTIDYLKTKSTDDLLTLYKKSGHSDEGFEAIKRSLVERKVPIPLEETVSQESQSTPARQQPSLTVYARSFAKYGFYAGCLAMFKFPSNGLFLDAIRGAVGGGGGAALAMAVGSFFDALNENPYGTIQSKYKRSLAVVSLLIGLVGLAAWFHPFVGLPLTIVGYVLGRKARLSSSRGMALTGMGLCLIGLLLSSFNAYLGAVMTVRARP